MVLNRKGTFFWSFVILTIYSKIAYFFQNFFCQEPALIFDSLKVLFGQPIHEPHAGGYIYYKTMLIIFFTKFSVAQIFGNDHFRKNDLLHIICSIYFYRWRRISSTFSVLRSFSYLRPSLYFDFFVTSLLRPFWSNFTSTYASRPIRNPYLTKCRNRAVEVQKRSN